MPLPRLITSKPKLRTVGRLLHWDVEPCELDTFIGILRYAVSATSIFCILLSILLIVGQYLLTMEYFC